MRDIADRATKVILACATAAALSACASGSMTVLAPAQIAQGASYSTVRVEPLDDTAKVHPRARELFANRLNEHLFAKKSGFTPGDALTVRFRFVEYDEGDQFQRWMAPFMAGKGTMTVEATFLDKEQKELSRINVGASLSMGMLGGDFDDAIGRAARELADYAIKTF